MIKQVSLEDAKKEFLDKYDNGKSGKHFSLGEKLHFAYQDFCFNKLNRLPVSERVQVLMVKDMMENSEV